jgi:hypothetical protein
MVRFYGLFPNEIPIKTTFIITDTIRERKSMVIKWLITMLFTTLFVLINDFALQKRTRYFMAPFSFIRKLMNYIPSKLR